MAGYDFLSDVLVIEVAKLGPSALGGILADMGATVIKVEQPSEGDPVRYGGAYSVGGPKGFGFLHLRWNRGKQSVGLDLHTDEGKALFKTMIAQADVVIEGMRAGVLERLGLGFEALRAVNPKLVFCSVSGLGLSGPYAKMGSQGPSFDAFGGLSATPEAESPTRWTQREPPSIAMYAMGPPAAVGVLSALHRAQRTGEGALIEVAAAEIAAHWLPEPIDSMLNQDAIERRPSATDDQGRLAKWPRLDNYRTADGKILFLMLYYDKFWRLFLELVGREELDGVYAAAPSMEAANARIAEALTEIIATRTRDAWIELLRPNGVPVMPVNTHKELAQDPHFLGRDNTYAVNHPEAGELRLTSTPIRSPGRAFAPALAPTLGQHTDDVLARFAGLSAEQIQDLKARGVAL